MLSKERKNSPSEIEDDGWGKADYREKKARGKRACEEAGPEVGLLDGSSFSFRRVDQNAPFSSAHRGLLASVFTGGIGEE